MTPEKAIMWIDGSCGRDGGIGAWAAVVRLPSGELRRSSGILESGGGSPVEAELLALYHGLELLDDGCQVDVVSDCKSLCDAVQGAIDHLKTPSWGKLVARLDARPALVKARWKPRKKSQGMLAAHYLANAARALGELSDASFLVPAPAA